MPDRDDATRALILHSRRSAPEGVTHLPVSLPAFFIIVRRVGRDPGLLLLTLRALHLRSEHAPTRVADLSWMLGATHRRIGRWLDRLSEAGLLVYDLSSGHGADVIVLEIVAEESTATESATVPIGTARHDLPTHWFLHVLPRLGRTSFLVYLYLLAQEASRSTRAALVVERLIDDLALRGHLHARLHLRRLARHGLLVGLPGGRGLLLRDPPPLSKAARLALKLRQFGGLPRSLTGWIALFVTVALPLLAFLYLLTHRLP